jgi:hypothetical protein
MGANDRRVARLARCGDAEPLSSRQAHVGGASEQSLPWAVTRRYAAIASGGSAQRCRCRARVKLLTPRA